MPDYTRRGIAYPTAHDLIKSESVPSKLAEDLKSQAATTDAAIGTEGTRIKTEAVAAATTEATIEATSAATQAATQNATRNATAAATTAAIRDANTRYGQLPGRISEAETRIDRQDTTISGHETRLEAVERLGGLESGDVSDATVANVVTNPTSLSSEALRLSFDLRSANNTKNYAGTSQERLEQALADTGVVQLDEDVTHTDNIDGFWATNIFGSGVIHLPDGATFTPDPKPGPRQQITNTIYLDASEGDDDNDGLTPGTAMRTRRAVYENVLRRLTAQQAAGAQWVIQMSGTFTDPAFVMNELPRFPRNLIWRGEPMEDGSPVTEIQYPGSGSSIGLYFEPGVDHIIVENIHFRGWQVGFNGYGTLMKFGGKLTVRDCEYTDNDIGLAAIQNTTFSFSYNKFNPGNNTAITTQYNATGNANYNELDGGGTDANGIRVSRNVVAHTDYNHIRGYLRGIYVDMSSRTAAIENTIYNCTRGVEVSSAAEWNNNGNIFYNNETNYAHYGLGREVRMHSSGAWTGGEMRIAATQSSPVYGFEQNYSLATSYQTIYTGGLAGEIPAQWFDTPGKRLRMKLHGEFLARPSAAIYFQIGTVDGDGTDWKPFILATVPGGRAGAFQIENIVQAIDITSQMSTATTLVGGSLGDPTEARTIVDHSYIDMNDQRYIRARARATSGSVELRMYYMEVFAIG